MKSEKFWNSLSTKDRLSFIEGCVSRTGAKIGVSNSKCTYGKLTSKVLVEAIDAAAAKGDKILKDVIAKHSPEKVIPLEVTPSEDVKDTVESLDLLIVFDDTGSMSSVRKQVRQKIDELTSTLFKEVKDLRIAVFIQNDYCDAPNELMMQDFTDSASTIKKFVHSDSPCGGGDSDECYELSLNKARSLNWKSPNRALVIIADAEPHKVGYTYRGIRYDLDWKVECAALAEMDVQIYSVQALGNRSATYFYEQMARITNGVKLDLSQFAHVETYIKAIAYRQSGNLDKFENSDPQFKTNLSLKNMFQKLRGFSGDRSLEDKMEFLSKFQVLKVDTDGETSIRDFVEMNGCTFQKGKGYYQLIERTADGKANSEEVQANKEVIFVDKSTGEVNSDTFSCRKLLGVPFGTKGKVKPLQIPDVMDKYEIFIQSNSYNRKLDPGVKFLYELEHI